MVSPGDIRLFLKNIEPVLQRDLQCRCDGGLRLRKAQRPVVLLCAGVPRDESRNSVEAFRYGIVDGELVLFDERSPSFTDLKKGSESFHIVTMPCEGNIAEFCQDAKRRSAEQTTFLSTDKESADLIYFSCLPWVELTALTNERDFDPDDAIPRISWGKFHERDGRKILGMSLELNHRFTDGVHIGKFAEALQNLISEL